jgi:hypothetical protein
MEKPQSDEANERRFDIEKDLGELTPEMRRLLGHQGLYDASQDTYKNPPEALSEWMANPPANQAWTDVEG